MSNLIIQDKYSLIKTKNTVKINEIKVPIEVYITYNNNILIIKGPLGINKLKINPIISIDIIENKIILSINNIKDKAIINTVTSNINNIITGVIEGYNKKLKLEGIGYKVTKDNNKLIFELGYSHKIEYEIPNNIIIKILTPTLIEIKGIEKNIVGEVANKFIHLRKHSNYKFKGIYYDNETPKLKVTKK